MSRSIFGIAVAGIVVLVAFFIFLILSEGMTGAPPVPTPPPTSTPNPFIEESASFLAENAEKEGVTVTDSGLQYEVIREGDGEHPAEDATVEVDYRGTLIDGTQFDSSYDRGVPAEFQVNQVIAGWTEALQLMPEGSEYRIYIPSDLAYGDAGRPPTIPPGAALIFDVELLRIVPPPPSQEESTAYLAENAEKEGVTVTDSGLQYEVIREGDGERPVEDSIVEMNYRGTLINGTEFFSTFEDDDPVQSPVQNIPISGWTEGIQLMSEGSEYRFYIPADLAFGDAGNPPAIPPGAAVILDVELLRIVPPPPSPEESTAYLAENAEKEGVTVTDSGLQYEVLEEGDGPNPSAADVVEVHYEGTLVNGEKFDSSYDRGQTAVFPLGEVIPGWTEGLQLMSVGSKYRFAIPSDLAYGEQGEPRGNIPPGATLIFEVELLDIPSLSEATEEAEETSEAEATDEATEAAEETSGAVTDETEATEEAEATPEVEVTAEATEAVEDSAEATQEAEVTPEAETTDETED